jgi:hypothetical protein
MNDINKKIDIVKNIIIKYFYNNNIYKSSCLAQSYILYKYIYDLKTNIKPELIKGYIINENDKVYYGHFWVEYNNEIYDISTETYLLDYDYKLHNFIKNKMRILVKNIPDNILLKYKNLDDNIFNIIKENSYIKCIENNFLDDVKNKNNL